MKAGTYAIILCALVSAVLAGEEKPAPEVKEETMRTERGDLQVLIEAEGTLDALRRKKLKVTPEELPGPFAVNEIIASGQLVETGAILVRLDTAPVERIIRGAQETLDGTKLKIQAMADELENLKTANRQKIERMTLDLKQAERDLKVFEKFGEEQMLSNKALALKYQEHGQANREQELEQLEKMYRDTQLASETKDIVLQRTRREVALGKEGLGLSRKSESQLKEFDHPALKEKLSRTIEQKKQDIEVFNTVARLDEAKRGEELKATERFVRDTQERMARLQSDLAQMTVKAPFAGVFRHGGIEAGDKVNPHAAFADLLDMSHFEVKFFLMLKELQVVKPGDSIKVRIQDMMDLDLDGKIEEIAWTASAEGQEKGPPRYLVRAKVDDNKVLRHGARVNVQIRGEKLKKVVAIPKSIVFYEEGRAHCRVRTAKGVEKREITVGLGDRERVPVLRGLDEGETVVIKEGKK